MMSKHNKIDTPLTKMKMKIANQKKKKKLI